MDINAQIYKTRRQMIVVNKAKRIFGKALYFIFWMLIVSLIILVVAA